MIAAPARIHDLLRLRPEAELLGERPAPGWVAASLSEAPWVVVCSIRGGAIGVRVRGATLAQRFDAVAPLFAVAYRSTPEDLAGRRCEPWRAAQAPALAALGRVDPVLTRFGHPWGPIGSVALCVCAVLSSQQVGVWRTSARWDLAGDRHPANLPD